MFVNDLLRNYFQLPFIAFVSNKISMPIFTTGEIDKMSYKYQSVHFTNSWRNETLILGLSV